MSVGLREILAPSRTALAARSLAGSSLRLSAANLAFVALSTLQVLVVGAIFGTGRAYELFILAWMVPEWCLFGFGNVMQMHLTPALLRLKVQEGPEAEQTAAWSLVVWTSGVLALACALGALLARGILGLAAPGIQAAEMPEAVRLFRFLLLAAFIQGLVRLFSSLHRAGHSLVLAAALQSATPLVVMALLLGARELGPWALALGFLGGALVNLACLVPGPLSWGFLRTRGRPCHGIVGDLARSAIPLMLASAGFRLVVLLDRTVASGLEQGDATVLRYSLFFLMSVQSILVMPLLNVGYNRLSALHSEGDQGAVAVVFSFLQVLWLLVVPATLALVVFASPLVAFFLGRAAFDLEAVTRTAHVLEAFAPALPFMVGYMIVLQAFLSRGRYLYVTALSIVIPFASFALKLVLGPRLGVRGVALATAVTMAAWFLALLFPLWREASVEARAQLRLRSGRVLQAAALTVALLWLVWPLLPRAPFPRLLVGGASLAVLYASLLFLIARAHLVSLWREFKGTPLGA